jgi:hypothetical protein
MKRLPADETDKSPEIVGKEKFRQREATVKKNYGKE